MGLTTGQDVAGVGRVPAHFLADLYTFDWGQGNARVALVSATAVALCLVVGIAVGHPGGALIAGGGALTVGFGANQRIADSRVLPMLLAIVAAGSAAYAGTVAGHKGWAILVASAVSAAIYGVLTIRDVGVAWVGQQASVALFVSSAFPSGPKLGLQRAGLMMLGGAVQTVMTTAALKLVPELKRDLLEIPRGVYEGLSWLGRGAALHERRRELLERLHALPKALPAPDRWTAAVYAGRLVVTTVVATEVYRRLGIRSGYWIPMTALLVLKPRFFETLSRGLARTGGTLAGATLATLVAAHVPLGMWWLAGLTAVFALGCFLTVSVNYGLFSVCMTSYIVFLLSLNQIPGPELAHRRLFCTAAGAGIALAVQSVRRWW